MRWAKRLVLVLLLTCAVQARAEELEVVPPESAGLSPEKLDDLRSALQKLVDEERLAGAVTLIARRGKVGWLDATGWQDREAQVPMDTGTIFRIASMTKPITSAAVMILHDEGRLELDDPVGKFIPELAQMTVQGAAGSEPTPAENQITIKHLLTHTSGLTYHWDQTVGGQYTELGITHGLIEDADTIGDSVKVLSRVPLLHEPGQQFTYGLNTDVLGYLVEVVAGQTLDEFFQERMFAPLSMTDTGFLLDEEQAKRLAIVYRSLENGKATAETRDEIVESNYLHYTTTYPTRQKTYYSGGGGLCSTAADYFRFCQMLLDQGKADGKQILKSETVDLMTSPLIKYPGQEQQTESGFGLGFGVAPGPGDDDQDGEAAYAWGGFFYTSFFVDPEKDLVAISMAQLHPVVNVDWNERFRDLVYAALVD